MALLFFWIGKYYYRDTKKWRKTYVLNQNSELMNQINIGEHIWAFTRRSDNIYVLALDLDIIYKNINSRGSYNYQYGKYYVEGDNNTSRYFDIQYGPDVEPLIRSLSIKVEANILGHSFQGRNGVRLLEPNDEQRLRQFSLSLPTI